MVDQIAYVVEGIYAFGSDVKSVKIEGEFAGEYPVTEVTQEVVDGRAY